MSQIPAEATALVSFFTLLAYRADGVDTCRGCVMGSSPSNFVIETATTAEAISKTWAQMKFDEPSGREYCETEYTLLLNGRRPDDEWSLDDTWSYQEMRDEVARLTEQHLEQLNAARAAKLQEAARAAREREATAELERRAAKDAAELAEFERLQAKFGKGAV